MFFFLSKIFSLSPDKVYVSFYSRNKYSSRKSLPLPFMVLLKKFIALKNNFFYSPNFRLHINFSTLVENMHWVGWFHEQIRNALNYAIIFLFTPQTNFYRFFIFHIYSVLVFHLYIYVFWFLLWSLASFSSYYYIKKQEIENLITLYRITTFWLKLVSC